MGLNSTILVLNDRLGDIEKDDKLGKMLALAINQNAPPEEGLNPAGNGVYVVETHHADNLAIVAVGGNTAQVLGYVPTVLLGTQSTKERDTKNIIRELALGLGMGSFVEKPKKLSKVGMNEFIKKEYGCRMITLRNKKSEEKPARAGRKKVS